MNCVFEQEPERDALDLIEDVGQGELEFKDQRKLETRFRALFSISATGCKIRDLEVDKAARSQADVSGAVRLTVVPSLRRRVHFPQSKGMRRGCRISFFPSRSHYRARILKVTIRGGHVRNALLCVNAKSIKKCAIF